MTALSPLNTLIVFAIEDEAREHFNDFARLYCGVGKVNAAYRLTRRLSEWHNQHGTPPRLVLNLGTAGSTHFKAGRIVNCTHFVQRDVDATALGQPMHVIPFDETPSPLKNGLRYEKHPEAICGSGDSFVTNSDMSHWNVVDMEAYALAKVCWLENVPFGCLKYISDAADSGAAGSWHEQLEKAAKNLRSVLIDLSR